MIVNSKFHPSKIEDEIYDAIIDHIVAEPGTYDRTSVDVATKILNKHGVTWMLGSEEWQNCAGEVVFISWIEFGHLHMIGWDVAYD